MGPLSAWGNHVGACGATSSPRAKARGFAAAFALGFEVSPMDPLLKERFVGRYAPSRSGMGPVAQPVFKTGEVV
jgi:hypothetical protein